MQFTIFCCTTAVFEVVCWPCCTAVSYTIVFYLFNLWRLLRSIASRGRNMQPHVLVVLAYTTTFPLIPVFSAEISPILVFVVFVGIFCAMPCECRQCRVLLLLQTPIKFSNEVANAIAISSESPRCGFVLCKIDSTTSCRPPLRLHTRLFHLLQRHNLYCVVLSVTDSSVAVVS